MTKKGKKYRDAAAKVDPLEQYSRADAIKLIKETAYTNFDPTVELHMRLEIGRAHV